MSVLLTVWFVRAAPPLTVSAPAPGSVLIVTLLLRSRLGSSLNPKSLGWNA